MAGICNKLIAKAFKETGLSERYGTGIRRIINICSDYGLKQPQLEEVFNGFRVTLFKAKLKVTDNLTENQSVIVSLMANSGVTISGSL
ncbi:MAG: ATP-binding protein [Desulfosalsimonadaceae bacterium]